ncbi:MAG: murein biosynthesis integral membrane protein MurJ [Anaerolineae bacterium]|nr:murein biosynthesis integral membrane protein MurJ [Gemmatimonadaceae bacterium]
MTDPVPADPPPSPREGTGRHALLVASGIFASRIFGLVRQRFLSHYLGLSDAADAFNAAFRIPNVLQNLFGEGVLSASFIPVYARMLAQGERKEAARVAGAVASLLGLVTSLLVLLGVLATPWLIDLIAPGFQGAKRELTIRLVRILFPGMGLLVLSAWCLGVLNSHRRFLLSYTAPVVWNVAIIASLVAFGGKMGGFELAEMAAWGSVVGSCLQFLVQLPLVLRLLDGLHLSLRNLSSNVRVVVRNFVPVFIGRGVVQISAYTDTLLASLLPSGAVTGIANAQVLYTLPVSLFGMSVSAAELPAMSGALGAESDVASYLRQRLSRGLRRIAFFVIPSAMAFFALGDVIAAALFQTGRFTHADATFVWAILAGSAVGLLASTLGRLYSSTFYALRDTRTPLRFAIVRVILGTGLGYLVALRGPALVGIDARWGAAGLTAAGGVAAWVELALLRRALALRIGATGLKSSLALRLWGAALVGATVGLLLKNGLGARHPLLVAIVVLGAYGLLYVGLAAAFGVEEWREIAARVPGLKKKQIPQKPTP